MSVLVDQNLAFMSGLCCAGSVEVERCAGTGETGRYGAEVLEKERFTLPLLAPIGAWQVNGAEDTFDREQVREIWRFDVIEGHVSPHDRIFYGGQCFEVTSVKAVVYPCLGGRMIHHVEVIAIMVQG